MDPTLNAHYGGFTHGKLQFVQHQKKSFAKLFVQNELNEWSPAAISTAMESQLAAAKPTIYV